MPKCMEHHAIQGDFSLRLLGNSFLGSFKVAFQDCGPAKKLSTGCTKDEVRGEGVFGFKRRESVSSSVS